MPEWISPCRPVARLGAADVAEPDDHDGHPAHQLPHLRHRRIRWLIVPPFQPGTQPIAALAETLAELPPRVDALELERKIRADPATLVERMRAVSGRHRHLLVVDQFEELSTMAGEDEATQFLGLLREALMRDADLWVIATLRSEFLTSLLSSRFAELARLPVTVGALDDDALSEVIEGPAELAGVRFGPGLVSRMVTDTGGGDSLPLLAYVLQRSRCARPGRSRTCWCSIASIARPS